MKLILPEVHLITQDSGVTGMFKHIEKCGRVCYKSEDKITDTSCLDFVSRMIKSKHGTTLEHATVYLIINSNIEDSLYIDSLVEDITFYKTNPYSHFKEYFHSSNNEVIRTCYITTNFRVLVENNRLDDIEKYGCEPTELHDRRYTFEFTCDIGVSREFNRHRKDSANEESTRYCNYSKDKFNNEITYTLPVWLDDEDKIQEIEEKLADMSFEDYCYIIGQYEDSQFNDIDFWLFGLMSAEYCYNNLIRLGWKAELARNVLNLNTKTTLVHTAFKDDWEHFWELRADGISGAPHPSAKELAEESRSILNGRV